MQKSIKASKKVKNNRPVIGIIGGKGKLGNWFKIFFEKNGLEVIIADKDTALSNKELASQADIVVVSVPIKNTPETIKEIRGLVRKDALLTDLTSIKKTPLNEMAKASSGTLGMHPLFGPLTLEIKGQTVVFCRQRSNKWVDYLKGLLQQNGAKVIEMTPDKHDEQMALVQALLSFSNLSYAGMLAKKHFQPTEGMLTPIFKIQSMILGRALAQNPELYASIEMENSHFQKIVKEYHKEVGRAVKIIQRKDYKSFDSDFVRSKNFFAGFIKQAQEKSSEILHAIDRQPIKLGKPKKITGAIKTIGYLGPEGTFSWQAAHEIATPANELVPHSNIGDIFNSVQNRKVDIGIVPIENSTAGMVSDTIQSFVDSSVFAVGSFKLPIHHCLVSKGAGIKEIKTVKSHPQALAQCRNWLESNIPSVKKEASSSTIAPVFEDTPASTAFILSAESAKKYGLKIIARNIEDSKENFTRFFVISETQRSKAPAVATPPNTLLLLSAYDKPGVLRDILGIFADKKINLSSLHSIPSRSHPWDYMFFVEVEKPLASKEIQSSLKELEQFCPLIKIIGTV